MGSYGLPFAPPVLYGHRPSASIRDLILMGGQERADAARRSGELWANALGNIGAIAGGAIQQYGQRKEEEKRQSKQEQALLGALGSRDDADPQGSAMRFVQVLGPKEGLKMAEGFNALRKNATNEDPKTHLQTARAGIQFWDGLSPEGKAQAWPQFRATLDPTVKKLGLPVELPEAYDPSFDEMVKKAGGAIDSFLGREAKEAPKPKLTTVTVAGPDGAPMKKGFTDEQLAAGVPEYIAPKTDKPEKSLAEKAAEAEAISAAHARGAASVKAPEQQEEYSLDPQGVVLSGFGPKQKSAVQAQAKAAGLPVFQNAQTQAKGANLRGIYEDAAQLKALLDDPEVKDNVGALAGKWGQFKANFVDLPPKVQLAYQLMNSLSDTELRKRSGASAGEPEMQRIYAFSTDPKKPYGHNLTAIQRMLETASREFKGLSGVGLAPEKTKSLADDLRKDYGTK